MAKDIQALLRRQDKCCKGMVALAMRLEPISTHLRSFQYKQVQSVAGGVHVAFMTAACILLAWLDWQLPLRCITGFCSTGKLEWTGVLRKVDAPDMISEEELLSRFKDNLVKLKSSR